MGTTSTGDIDRPATGSAYDTVIDLGTVQIARRAHLLTVWSGQDQVHVDLEGRLHRAWLGGDGYQRGLDGRVRRVRIEQRARTEGRDGADRPQSHRRWLEIDMLAGGEKARVLERTREVLLAAAGALPPSGPRELHEPLARAAGWDLARYAAEEERFDRIYDPIPILPPDQNRALVLQATLGCAWNHCSFCHLYHDQPFRARSAAEFREHVREVLALAGRALPLRRGVFLGQANALCVEQSRLLEIIRVVREQLADGDRWPLASFIDSFTRRRTVAELTELRERGLASVALGLESGSARVLECLSKPAEVAQAIELARELAAASIAAGIIILVGAGGRRHAREHEDETVRAVSDMRLARRDRVYLSPLHIVPGSAYERLARREEIGGLSRPEMEEQAARIRRRLRAAGLRAPIALYDIRRFIY